MQAVKAHKAIKKDLDTGNLLSMKKNLENLSAAVDQLREMADSISEEVEGFDTKAYFASGDFTKGLLESCEEKGVNVIGEKGIYEMFPYKVRVVGDDEHDPEVYLNRKKVASFRPSYVVETIRAEQEKLNKTKFNEVSFMDEIAEAYETACLKSGARIGSTQKLEKIYKALAPMARARKEYDKMAFAFDLSRIYEKGTDAWITKDGRRYYFGTSKDGKSGYRVLSSTGVENFVFTLKLINEGE